MLFNVPGAKSSEATVIGSFSRHRDPPWFRRMFELAVAASLGDLAPAFALDQPYDLLNLYRPVDRVIVRLPPFEFCKKCLGQGFVEIVRNMEFTRQRAELSGREFLVAHVAPSAISSN